MLRLHDWRASAITPSSRLLHTFHPVRVPPNAHNLGAREISTLSVMDLDPTVMDDGSDYANNEARRYGCHGPTLAHC